MKEIIAADTQRIAKNSLFLYLRMLFTMGVSFYTSMVILNTLGVVDFGVYNVVGGVTVMLSFFNGSLQSASSRYLTFSIGKGNIDEVKKVFRSVLGVHLILALVLFVLCETVGLWFVLNKLIIPEERYGAALWVYQCSIIAMLVSVVSVPFNALVIAHEKMNAFAYISIVESALKLSIVFLLLIIPYDKLISYSILFLLVQLMLRAIYTIYCSKNFVESREKPQWNSKLSKELIVYAGWASNGSLALLANSQGINILLNMFFGPVVNAARGLTTQVQAAVLVFVQNYQMALSPPIIKAYATNDLQNMHKLVIASSKYGYLVMILVVFPLFVFAPVVLQLWLGSVPEYTISFVRITLLICLLAPLRQAMINAIHATGNIKRFQLYEGTTMLLVLPFSYVGLKMFGISPDSVMIIYGIIETFVQCIRFYIVLPLIKIPFEEYFKKALIRPLLLTASLFLMIFFLPTYDSLSVDTFLCMAVVCMIEVLFIFFIGLSFSERKKILLLIRTKLS